MSKPDHIDPSCIAYDDVRASADSMTESELRDLLLEAADFIESCADELDDAAGATTFAHNLRIAAKGV